MITQPEFTLFNEDSTKRLKKFEDNSIDLTLTSPPYCIGKAYDIYTSIDGFREVNQSIMEEVYKKTKNGGSICWQVGHHIKNGEIIPLDFIVYDMFSRMDHNIKLRNRIVWTFGHGANCKKRFSGRHETILWFTKGDNYFFDLDSVRIKQKYPGKKYYKGKKKGEYSCNPLGKNPGDVWEIPNVKANHIEKTLHPCQFPIALAQRIIRALCPPRGIVLDPFMGVGSTGAASMIEKRNFRGIEIDKKYHDVAKKRIERAQQGVLQYRDMSTPIFDPKKAGAVGRDPLVDLNPKAS
ncbi:site-specific DNA-methyltransferase [Parasaccharibacter sp. TMW 2.1891]|uniref:DNA-methyltransferase n=1 Tax=Parasaccharibacter sp. TMW 2.1891 TaxID=2267836 RepID=UPI002010F33E|nr:site-specific DNA-methyltransferase [Parasaccharibacter sp. TMW 2.1891]MCL1513748.1 site-specific DNA-methyltransferase [Parasaccharibacter sp. TMW 2.1891]